LLIGLVMLITGEGDDVILTWGLGLLLQLATDPTTKSERIRMERYGIRMSFGICRI